LLDDDTVRRWHGAFAQGGLKALMRLSTPEGFCIG